MDTLKRLEDWYRSVCNGDWEHTYGVTLETVDNPGWLLKVDLIDTPLYEREFSAIHNRRSEYDWFHCEIVDGVFRGSCSTGALEELISCFLSWAEDR